MASSPNKFSQYLIFADRKKFPRPVQMYSSLHYNDVIMTTIASQITSLTAAYSTVYSDADQRKHQSSVSLAFVWEIHRRPVNSAHKGQVTRKMFPFNDVIMYKLDDNPASLMRSRHPISDKNYTVVSWLWKQHQGIYNNTKTLLNANNVANSTTWGGGGGGGGVETVPRAPHRVLNRGHLT